MKKIFYFLLCTFLLVGITGCGNDNKSDKNNSLNDSVNENNKIDDGSIIKEEKYDQIIHCDLTQFMRADETEGTYFEYFIKDEKVVKYIRFKVLPKGLNEKDIDKYLDSLKKQGWKNVNRDGRNIKIVVESVNDVSEDNNPLDVLINEVRELLIGVEGLNCYEK